MSAPDFSTRPRARRPPAWELALVAVGLLAAALGARAVVGTRAEGWAVRARLAEVRGEIEGARRRVSDLERRSSDGVTGQVWLTAEAPPARVVAQISDLLPPDVRLDALSLTYGRSLEVEMRVVARTPGAYDRLLQRLEASPRLKDLVLGAESREGRVETTVRATFVPGS
jgi:Tfp pilus assembly protein PilN